MREMTQTGEPDVSEISWRPTEEWEKEGVMAAKMARREEAAALVSGIKPYASSPARHWPDEDPTNEPPKRKNRGRFN